MPRWRSLQHLGGASDTAVAQGLPLFSLACSRLTSSALVFDDVSRFKQKYRPVLKYGKRTIGSFAGVCLQCHQLCQLACWERGVKSGRGRAVCLQVCTRDGYNDDDLRMLSEMKRFEDVYQTRETWWRTNVEEHPDGQVGFFFGSSNKVYFISGQLRLGQEVWCLHLIFLVLFLIMQAKGVRNRGTFKIWVNRTVSATLKQHHSISPHSFVSCHCWVYFPII